MQERRKQTRTRVLKGAKLVTDKQTVINCTVRDLSNAGAGIEVPNIIDLPERLDVSLDKCRSFRKGRLAWRKWPRGGIEFS